MLRPAIAWFPHSASHQHASSRIRAYAVYKWLLDQRQWPMLPMWTAKPGALAVVFKRPEVIGTARRLGCRPIIYDISDNPFDDTDEGASQRAARHRVACEQADQVVVSTAALADAVERNCTMRHTPAPVIIPDCIDPLVAHGNIRAGNRFNSFLWFGVWGSKHQTTGGLRDLYAIASAFRGHATTLVICSNGEPTTKYFPSNTQIRYLLWDPLTFPKAVALSRTALIPVTPTPYSICKTHNRVTTAIACGLHVIASQHPSYDEFGCTIASDKWAHCIQQDAGILVPTDKLAPYGLDQIGKKWDTLLQTLTGIA